MSLRLAAAVSLVLGLALILPFDAALTTFLGIVFLFAFVVLGVFLIASPEFLGREADADD